MWVLSGDVVADTELFGGRVASFFPTQKGFHTFSKIRNGQSRLCPAQDTSKSVIGLYSLAEKSTGILPVAPVCRSFHYFFFDVHLGSGFLLVGTLVRVL